MEDRHEIPSDRNKTNELKSNYIFFVFDSVKKNCIQVREDNLKNNLHQLEKQFPFGIYFLLKEFPERKCNPVIS